MKQISREQYYILIGAVILGWQRQKQVRDEVSKIEDIFGDGVVLDALYDAINNPLIGDVKDSMDHILLQLGVEILWKPINKNTDKEINVNGQESNQNIKSNK